MVFDPYHHYLLLFGGRRCEPGLVGDGSCTGWHDTWSWNGTNWTRRRPTHSPDASLGTLVYDTSARADFFLSRDGAGWQWDGTDWSRAWSGLNPPAPAAVAGPALQDVNFSIGYDEDRSMVVVLATRLVTDVVTSQVVQTKFYLTSAWDGSQWLRLAASSSPTVGEAAGPELQFGLMAFDRDRHVLVAMGIKSTWTWDGSRWAPHSPGLIQIDGQELYDTMGHRMLWVDSELDGKHSYGKRHIYAWSGDAWTEVRSRNQPCDDDPAVSFDETHGVMVLFGGRSDC